MNQSESLRFVSSWSSPELSTFTSVQVPIKSAHGKTPDLASIQPSNYAQSLARTHQPTLPSQIGRGRHPSARLISGWRSCSAPARLSSPARLPSPALLSLPTLSSLSTLPPSPTIAPPSAPAEAEPAQEKPTCEWCLKQNVKCSGRKTCARCKRLHRRCVFPDAPSVAAAQQPGTERGAGADADADADGAPAPPPSASELALDIALAELAASLDKGELPPLSAGTSGTPSPLHPSSPAYENASGSSSYVTTPWDWMRGPGGSYFALPLAGPARTGKSWPGLYHRAFATAAHPPLDAITDACFAETPSIDAWRALNDYGQTPIEYMFLDAQTPSSAGPVRRRRKRSARPHPYRTAAAADPSFDAVTDACFAGVFGVNAWPIPSPIPSPELPAAADFTMHDVAGLEGQDAGGLASF